MGRVPKSSPPGIATRARPAGQEGAEHDDRGPHPLDQLVGRLGHEDGGGVDQEVARGTFLAVSATCDRPTNGAEHVRHDVDVDDVRDPVEHVTAVGQQTRRHELQGRVLRPAGPD